MDSDWFGLSWVYSVGFKLIWGDLDWFGLIQGDSGDSVWFGLIWGWFGLIWGWFGVIRGDSGWFRVIRGNAGRFWVIRGDSGWSWVIRGDPGRSGMIRGDLWWFGVIQVDSKIFDSIFFFFTWASSRGAFAPNKLINWQSVAIRLFFCLVSAFWTWKCQNYVFTECCYNMTHESEQMHVFSSILLFTVLFFIPNMLRLAALFEYQPSGAGVLVHRLQRRTAYNIQNSC